MKEISKEIFYGFLIETFGVAIGLLFSNKESQLFVFAVVTAIASILAFGNARLTNPAPTKSKIKSKQSPLKWWAIGLASIGWGLSQCFLALFGNQSGVEIQPVLFLFWGLSISLIVRQLLKSINLQVEFRHVLFLFLGWGGGFSLASLFLWQLEITEYSSYQLFILGAALFGSLMTGLAIYDANKRFQRNQITTIIFGWFLSWAFWFLISTPLFYTISPGGQFAIFFFIFGAMIGVTGSTIMLWQITKNPFDKNAG